jgi:hypothetical protein
VQKQRGKEERACRGERYARKRARRARARKCPAANNITPRHFSDSPYPRTDLRSRHLPRGNRGIGKITTANSTKRVPRLRFRAQLRLRTSNRSLAEIVRLSRSDRGMRGYTLMLLSFLPLFSFFSPLFPPPVEAPRSKARSRAPTMLLETFASRR